MTDRKRTEEPRFVKGFSMKTAPTGIDVANSMDRQRRCLSTSANYHRQLAHDQMLLGHDLMKKAELTTDKEEKKATMRIARKHYRIERYYDSIADALYAAEKACVVKKEDLWKLSRLVRQVLR